MSNRGGWNTSIARGLARLALALALLAGASGIWIPAEPAEASCCVCRNGGCGAGFCADALNNIGACHSLCQTAGCPDIVFNSTDVCAGGCDVATQLPTATPTNTVVAPTNTAVPPPTPTTTTGPSFTPTTGPSATATGTPTPGTCCQGFQMCAISNVLGQCPDGHDKVEGGVCVSTGNRPGSSTPLMVCALKTATPTVTQTATITSTPSATVTRSSTLTLTPTATLTATSTATVTATPRATDTFPPSPTPFVCCRNSANTACSNSVGQNFSTGMRCDDPSLNIPVGYASCMSDRCVPFQPTPLFTTTPTHTGTRTSTPTPTPTFDVPTSIDPYKCYRIKDGSPRFTKRDVSLVEQFGLSKGTALKPFLACNPSVQTSNNTSPPQPPGAPGTQVNPEAHTVCFKLKDRQSGTVPGASELRVRFHDEAAGGFTTVKPEYIKEDLLCMPAALIPTPRPTPIACSPGGEGNPPLKACPPRTPAFVCFENVCSTPTPSS